LQFGLEGIKKKDDEDALRKKASGAGE